MRILVALALLLALQDADRLVDRLSDEDIAVRERAAEQLLELGTAARSALEKAAKSGDAEVAARAKSLLDQIALDESRRAALGPTLKVRLAAGMHTLGALAEAVEAQTRIPLRVPDALRESEVRIGETNATLLEALDRICAAQGGLRPAAKQPPDAIVLEEGRPANAPTCFSGPFRVWIDRIRLDQRDPFATRWEAGSMVLGIGWQPNVHPLVNFFSEPEFEITEMTGDDGKPIAVRPEMARLYSGRNFDVEMPRGFRDFIPFEFPARGVRRVSRLRGTVELALPLKTEMITFEKPLEAQHRERNAGACTIELKKCERREGSLVVELHIALPEPPEGERKRRVEIRARCGPEDIQLLDKESKTHAGRTVRNAHSGGAGTETQEYRLLFPESIEPAALRLRFVTETFTRRMEFEFRDIELP